MNQKSSNGSSREEGDNSVSLRIDHEELQELLSALGGWYKKHQRDLPFRKNVHWYTTLVSEVMLQQTRVQAMLPAYVSFLDQFPDVQSLARASESEVLERWAGLGYYSRARNLHKCAKRIVEEHGGMFPGQQKEALALPGIGPYTAAAVRSISMEIPDAVVDGNVIRVLSRLFFQGQGTEPPEEYGSESNLHLIEASDYAKAAEPAAQEIIRSSPLKPSVHNQSIMELGAMICTPGLPSCLLCPVRPYCNVFRSGGPALAAEIPPLKKSKKQDLTLEIFWVECDGQIWISKNPARPIFRNDWFLPCRISSSEGPIYSDFDEAQWQKRGKQVAATNDQKETKHGSGNGNAPEYQKRANVIGGDGQLSESLPEHSGETEIGFRKSKTTGSLASAKKSTGLNPTPVSGAEPVARFKHSIMHYRIQGELYAMQLSRKEVGSILKISSLELESEKTQSKAKKSLVETQDCPAEQFDAVAADPAGTYSKKNKGQKNQTLPSKSAGRNPITDRLSANQNSQSSSELNGPGVEWMQIQANEIRRYCPSSIIKKVVPETFLDS